ncbi:hypothetical protein [Companilactobacillus sp. FL22-1]|uniref:hypothetical protein n=1 Tax=Companilactobacillus sp. FL22-1 TaxID=3373892 RepID=UPI003754CF9F
MSKTFGQKLVTFLQGEIITIDFGRPVKFYPDTCPTLSAIGRWYASDDKSKYFLVYEIDHAEFPDRIINDELDDQHLTGYEIVHSFVTYP